MRTLYGTWDFARPAFPKFRNKNLYAMPWAGLDGEGGAVGFTVNWSGETGSLKRRAGRVVDGIGLENRRTRKGIGGSNPSLSAIKPSKNFQYSPVESSNHMNINNF